MGSFGSGRPGWRRKVDEFRSLDVNWLGRSGRLDPGFRGGLHQPLDDGMVVHLDLRAAADHLQIDVIAGDAEVGWATSSHVVPLIWLSCSKGGSQPLFVCPNIRAGQPCGCRAVKLYVAGPRIACRTCLGLVYQSQAEPRHERLLRRANKLRRALGGKPGMASPLPDRQKGQWLRTYEAKVATILELEAEAEAVFAERLGFG